MDDNRFQYDDHCTVAIATDHKDVYEDMMVDVSLRNLEGRHDVPFDDFVDFDCPPPSAIGHACRSENERE